MGIAADKINNYTLGRGELHFGQFRPDTQIPRGERYLGNSPELSYTASQETLDHYNSDRGIGVKDASVVTQQDYTGQMVLDSIDLANLAYFFMGESSTVTVASSTVADEAVNAVELGLSYQLGTTANRPAGAVNISTVTVANATTPANVPVAGVDYVVDLDLGRITILESATKIVNEDNLTVDYTIGASTFDQMISAGETIEGSLRYLAYNPAGAQISYFMPWVKISPNGDFNLKGDDWQQLPFNIEILKKGALAQVYAHGKPYNP